MARIKAPTITELMTAARQAFKHTTNMKKTVLESMTPLVEQWQAEHFPVGNHNEYMSGDRVIHIDTYKANPKFCDAKFKFGDDRTTVLFSMRMGVTNSHYPFKYDGNEFSPSAYAVWATPSVNPLTDSNAAQAEQNIQNYKDQHMEALLRASGSIEGSAIPKVEHLLFDIDNGVFGANTAKVFNMLSWSTYVSGRSKKAGQLCRDVSIQLKAPTNIAEEIAYQREVEAVKEMFVGTRYSLHQTDGNNVFTFKPCILPEVNDAAEKRIIKNYILVGQRIRL
jgi:hypothetical protein